jgi:hypothetical protein
MSKHPFSKSACALALLLFCLAFGFPAAAQSTTQGAIGGTVKDPQGAVVPNAAVTVKNDETNKESPPRPTTRATSASRSYSPATTP